VAPGVKSPAGPGPRRACRRRGRNAAREGPAGRPDR